EFQSQDGNPHWLSQNRDDLVTRLCLQQSVERLRLAVDGRHGRGNRIFCSEKRIPVRPGGSSGRLQEIPFGGENPHSRDFTRRPQRVSDFWPLLWAPGGQASSGHFSRRPGLDCRARAEILADVPLPPIHPPLL